MLKWRGRPYSEGGHDSMNSSGGPYGLKICHDGGPNSIADIVFIHGLRGHRVQTWTHVSNNIQVFWPEALLRHDIELSRIITFGYDADVINSWSKVGQGSLRTHAESLVNELKLLRQDTQTEHRAILFVAHSLGGLVFKEAMLISSGNPVDAIRMVYEKTAGACFLGVPHQGSELANGFFLNFLLNAAGFVKTTNKKTIALLQPQSEVLARVEDDFDNLLLRRASLGPPLQIQSFYETVPITGIGIVVSERSAKRHGSGLPLPIDGNHVEMVKFRSNQDTGYIRVMRELRVWVRAIQDPSQGRHDALPGQPIFPQVQNYPWQGQHDTSQLQVGRQPSHGPDMQYSTLPELAGSPVPHHGRRDESPMRWANGYGHSESQNQSPMYGGMPPFSTGTQQPNWSPYAANVSPAPARSPSPLIVHNAGSHNPTTVFYGNFTTHAGGVSVQGGNITNNGTISF